MLDAPIVLLTFFTAALIRQLRKSKMKVKVGTTTQASTATTNAAPTTSNTATSQKSNQKDPKKDAKRDRSVTVSRRGGRGLPDMPVFSPHTESCRVFSPKRTYSMWNSLVLLQFHALPGSCGIPVPGRSAQGLCCMRFRKGVVCVLER